MANEASRIKRVRATAAFYRKSLWLNANYRVEVWLKKDALAGAVTGTRSPGSSWRGEIRTRRSSARRSASGRTIHA
jgi:hypothetical protein